MCASCVAIVKGLKIREHENYSLLGYYAGFSSNSLPKFQDNLSFPSSRIQNPGALLYQYKQGGWPDLMRVMETYHSRP